MRWGERAPQPIRCEEAPMDSSSGRWSTRRAGSWSYHQALCTRQWETGGKKKKKENAPAFHKMKEKKKVQSVRSSQPSHTKHTAFCTHPPRSGPYPFPPPFPRGGKIEESFLRLGMMSPFVSLVVRRKSEWCQSTAMICWVPKQVLQILDNRIAEGYTNC